VVGVLITTIGILLLVLGLVGASIEVYVQLLSAIVQQQLSAIRQQLPAILQPEGEGSTAGDSGGPPFDSTDILRSLIETVINTPLWLALTGIGIVLIYFGLYISQRQRPWRQP
jgi:uncharacterized membrane protein